MFLNTTEKLEQRFHISPKQAATLLQVTALLAFVAVVAIVAFTVYGGGKGKITLKTGDDSVTIDLESDGGTQSLMERLFEADARDPKQGLRDDLVNRIRGEGADSGFSLAIREMLASYQGPFDKEAHSFRDIRMVPTADDIVALPRNLAVAERLRAYARNEKGIFTPTAVPMLVTPDAGLAEDEAAVCNGADYRNTYIQLLNPNNPSVQVSMPARRTFACDGERLKTNLVRIHPGKWAELFATAAAAGTQGAADLLASPPGYQPATGMVTR
jgi:hypothetical protein